MTLHFFAEHQTDRPLSIAMNTELAAAMNKWRLAQTPPLDAKEAIYALLWRGLAAGALPEGHAPQATVSTERPADTQTQALIRSFQDFLAGPHDAKGETSHD